MRALPYALLLLPAAVCAQGRIRSFKDDSMIRLVANPEAWHGKVVRTSGYVHIAFESCGIYVHRDDYENSIRANGFWLDLPDKDLLTYRKAGNTVDAYVSIEGTFNAKRHGHFGRYSGTIEKITRFYVLTPVERKPSGRNRKDSRSKPVQ